MSGRRRLAMLALVAAVAPLPAAACSFSWRRGNSPAEIREHPGIRQVTGTFHFIQPQGEDQPIATDARGMALGRIDSARGRYWNTFQYPPNEISIECGAYIAPAGNGATGTFWISRERRNGRYRLWMFEGHYPPRPAAAAPRH
jgi:hypothetical protein